MSLRRLRMICLDQTSESQPQFGRVGMFFQRLLEQGSGRRYVSRQYKTTHAMQPFFLAGTLHGAYRAYRGPRSDRLLLVGQERCVAALL